MTGFQPTHRFQALARALKAAAACCKLVSGRASIPGDLASQVVRAASSVALNLAEGSGRTGKDRFHHFRIAYASAREASTGIELLVACGCVSADDASEALEQLDRARAITWRLLHPKQRA